MQTTTRRPDGTFAQGYSGNPAGRPRREVEREYLRVAVRLVPPTTWAAIVEKAVEQALDGDAAARNFLAKILTPNVGDVDL